MATAGIYRITHKPTYKTYIGQSNNIGDRFTSHRLDLRNGTHHCKDLQSLWNAYGSSVFLFETVEYASELLEGIELQRWLLERERYHYTILSRQCLCLNSSYPVLVHANTSLNEMLQQRKEDHRATAVVAEDARKRSANLMYTKKVKLDDCSGKIRIHEDTLSKTSGFFAYIMGRSNPKVAAESQSALQPLYELKRTLEVEYQRLYHETYQLDRERRLNNSIARKVASRQKQVKARQKVAKKSRD